MGVTILLFFFPQRIVSWELGYCVHFILLLILYINTRCVVAGYILHYCDVIVILSLDFVRLCVPNTILGARVRGPRITTGLYIGELQCWC